MKNSLLLVWDSIETSLWPIPLLLCTASIVLAQFALGWERELSLSSTEFAVIMVPLSAARDILALIAGSVLSIGGVVFSISMVAFSLASGQYGPKILRKFLSDSGSKLSLGLFIGTSLYCLAILSRYADSDQPSITVWIALLLTVAALVSFIQFIHSIGIDLQADRILERIGGDFRTAMAELATNGADCVCNNDVLAWRRRVRGAQSACIASTATGYVQAVDYQGVLGWCREHRCAAVLRIRAGDFLLPGSSLLTLYGERKDYQAEQVEKLRDSIITGPLRTPVQDPEYPITQLNQLAARALSPGINDPGTAITCIDWFSMGAAILIDGDLPGKVLLDGDQQPVILTRGVDFGGILKAFYAPARQFSAGNIPVQIALLESLIRLAELTVRAERLEALAVHGRQLFESAEEQGCSDYDLRGLRQRYGRLKRLTGQADDR